MPRKTLFTAAAVVILLAVLPRLAINYGMDADAVRNAITASTLHETGHYQPNRLPGTPLYDYLLALLLPWGGHVAAGTLSLAAFLLAIAGFHRLVRGQPCWALWTAIFALTPILLVNAAVAMDYLVGLALLIWAYHHLRGGRDVLAFLLVGLAIGSRLSNLLVLLPFVVYQWTRGRSLWRAVVLSAVSGGIGIGCYAPILAHFGVVTFRVPPGYISGVGFVLLAGFNAIALLGLTGTAAVAFSLLLHASDIRRSLRDSLTGRCPEEAAEWLSLLLFTGLFVIHPDEPEYLLPILPFGYLLLSRWLSRRETMAVGLMIALVSVFDVNLLGGTSGSRAIAVRPAWGMVISDLQLRRKLESLRQHVGDYAFREPAVVMTGVDPLLTFENSRVAPASLAISPDQGKAPAVFKLTDREVFLVYALNRRQAEALQQEGYTLYVFSVSGPSILRHKYGYTPADLGIQVLPILEDGAYYTASAPLALPSSRSGN